MFGRITLLATAIIAVTIAISFAVIFLGSKPEPIARVDQIEPMARMDQIEPILQNVPCAILEASFDGKTLQLVGRAYDRSKVDSSIDALKSLDGVGEVRAIVEPISGAQCDLVKMLAPYVAANRDPIGGVAIKSRIPGGLFTDGDPLVVNVGTPKQHTYLYVDYYAEDGSVVHMMPSSAAPKNWIAADTTFTLGDASGQSGWIVGPPFGTEMIVALAAPEPLFREAREEVENAGTYTRILKENLDGLHRANPGGRVVADILFVTTTSKR